LMSYTLPDLPTGASGLRFGQRLGMYAEGRSPFKQETGTMKKIPKLEDAEDITDLVLAELERRGLPSDVFSVIEIMEGRERAIEVARENGIELEPRSKH